jgi:ammonium transporter Rh
VLLEKSVSKINLDMLMLINGDFGASTCLISMGAVLGKVSFPQLFVLATIESIFYTLNITLTLDYLGAEDAGGSITIHMFGAYFGIVASYFFKPQRGIEDKFKQGKSDYWSNLFTAVGTLIIFVYCPSFNAIFRDG